MWFYAKDGRKVGPVSDGELDSLATGGVIDASTLVWKEGMAEWLPLATARPGLAIPKVGQEACSQCGTFHSPDDLVTLSGLKVCGACKPAVVQRIREGVPLTSLEMVWRDGNRVVAQSGSALPKRCFRCNDSNVRKAVKISKGRSFTVNQRDTIKVHLCSACNNRRHTIAWSIGFLFGAVCVPVAALTAGPDFSIPAVVCSVLVAIACLMLVARLKKSSGNMVWIAGAGQQFLDSLPKWPN